jgi:putative ABC transport system ATP-binding protein
LIHADGASLVYWDHGKQVFACRDVHLEIRNGEFVGVLGPSGSGKSSLLYLLSGLKLPTSGSVNYEGQDLNLLSEDQRSRRRLREFGFIFQQPYLLGYLNVFENVILAASNGNSQDDAAALLGSLGMGSHLHRLPHELSVGERQRVCAARALVGKPKVIFADEPTAALDHANGAQVVQLLNRHRGAGSLVMVTHDPSMLEGADRVLKISEGHVQEA